MQNNFHQKVVLVTVANQGIGREMADVFDHGAQLAIVDLDGEKVQRTAYFYVQKWPYRCSAVPLVP